MKLLKNKTKNGNHVLSLVKDRRCGDDIHCLSIFYSKEGVLSMQTKRPEYLEKITLYEGCYGKKISHVTTGEVIDNVHDLDVEMIGLEVIEGLYSAIPKELILSDIRLNKDGTWENVEEEYKLPSRIYISVDEIGDIEIDEYDSYSPNHQK